MPQTTEAPPKPLSHRPKKSGSETRRKQDVMTFRVMPEDRQAIETAASAAGLTPGSYIRETLVKSSRIQKRRRPFADVGALPRLLGELNKSGGNLNQIARHMNQGGTPLVAEIEALLVTHRELLAVLRNAIGVAR